MYPSFWCDVCGGRFGPEALHLSSPRHVLTLNRRAAAQRIAEPPPPERARWHPRPHPGYSLTPSDRD
jgi:hypothetical protein